MDQMTIKNPLKFYHVKGGDSPDDVVTVATFVMPNGMVSMAFAFCSKKDRFCRATGRDIALTRLHNLSSPYHFVSRFNGSSAKAIEEMWPNIPKPRSWKNKLLVAVRDYGLTCFKQVK
jgi:hypothetical protein